MISPPYTSREPRKRRAAPRYDRHPNASSPTITPTVACCAILVQSSVPKSNDCKHPSSVSDTRWIRVNFIRWAGTLSKRVYKIKLFPFCALPRELKKPALLTKRICAWQVAHKIQESLVLLAKPAPA